MLQVIIDPPDAGRLWQDGQTYDPRIAYEPAETVRVMVLPDNDHRFAGWQGDVPAEQRWDMPLRIAVQQEKQTIIARLVPGHVGTQPLVFDSSFENGNGVARYIYPRSNKVVFEPEQIRGADNIWWRFRLQGLTPGECVQLWPLHASYGDAIDIVWAGDCHPVYSYDGETWHRFTGERPPYVQRFEKASVEISRNIPYDWSRSCRLRQGTRSPAQGIDVPHLCISEEGRPVWMWRFSEPNTLENAKPVIWVMARQHAFESHASWYAEGVIRWLASDAPEAMALRKRCTVYVVPIMDVDSVFKGGSGKEQLGPHGERADFNRAWGEPSPWSAIRAAQAMLKGRETLAFIDLHDPWYPRPSYWGFDAVLAPRVETFAALWSCCLTEASSSARWRHDLRPRSGDGVPMSSQDGQDREPTQGMLTSLAWSRANLNTKGAPPLSLLIETSHWHDGHGAFITKETLLAYGQALGMALARTDWR